MVSCGVILAALCGLPFACVSAGIFKGGGMKGAGGIGMDVPTIFKSKLPNIGFLGSGYDVLYGNPMQHSGPDPGFRAPIFEFNTYSHENSHMTADGEYSLPVGVHSNMCNACSLETSTNSVTGTESYSKELSSSCKLEVNHWFAKFSASHEFHEVKETTESEEKLLVINQAICCIYQAELLMYSLPPFHENFMNGLKELPLTIDDKDNILVYIQFLREFGTHYSRNILMGGRIGSTNEISATSWSSFESKSRKVDVAAHANFLGAELGLEVGGGSDRSEKEEFSESITKTTTFNYGGQPSFGMASITEAVINWYDSAVKKPMPIHYELEFIADLLTEENLPDVLHIETIGKNLNSVALTYCEDLRSRGKLAVESCSVVSRDPALPALWHQSGVGAPLPETSTELMDRVGVECPDGEVTSGFQFQRGGCYQSVRWNQGKLDFDKCPDNERHREGLLLMAHCTPHESATSREWKYTGTGAPTSTMGHFDRVGVQCKRDEVMSGLKFKQGGCNKDLSWYSKHYDWTACGNDAKGNGGLTALALCTKIEGGDMLGQWYTYGVGAPVQKLLDLERVGANCPSGQLAQGMKFVRGGCDKTLHWTQGKIHMEACDGRDGLVMQLLCVSLNSVPQLLAGPQSNSTVL